MAEKSPDISSTDSLISILDQMADKVQMDYSQTCEQPTSSGQNINLEKDDKYWERRRKNNLAAKKSRDARKIRENQLQCKVACLENANQILRTKLEREVSKNEVLSQKLESLQIENEQLRRQVSKS